MNATALHKKYTIAELHRMQEAIGSDPANQNPDRTSIFRLTAPARKKLDAIAWAITYHLRDRREADGDAVPDYGSTGRKSRRR